MIRFLMLFLALTLTIFIAGCIDYDEALELNADGSGTMALHLTLYKHSFEAFTKMMSAFSEDTTTDTSMFKLFTREDLEKDLKDRKGGVKLLDFKEQQTDSTVIYDIKYSFKDLKEMMAINEEMGKKEMVGESGSVPEVAFSKDKSGLWRFSREFQGASLGEMMPGEADTTTAETPPPDTTVAKDSLAESFAQGIDSAMSQMGSMMTGMAEMMKQSFANHRMRLTAKFPGTVVESNATSVNGNTTTWEYKFTDMAKAPKKLEAVIKP